MSDVVVVQANYTNPVHAQALRDVLNHYAKDPMGGGEALSPQVLEQLPAELAKRPHAFSVLAFVNGEAAGLVNCLKGSRPLPASLWSTCTTCRWSIHSAVWA